VALGGFTIAGDVIEIACPACNRRYRVGAASGERVDAEPAAASPGAGEEAPALVRAREPGTGEMKCPKCDEVQAATDACRACGLRRDRFAEFAAAEVDAPASLVALWAACVDDWESTAAHDRFLEATAGARAFPYAARRYRDVLRERPDDARARAGVDRVTRMAQAAMLGTAHARRASGEPEPYRNVVYLLLALVVLGGILGVYAMFRAARRDPEPSAPAIEIRDRRVPAPPPGHRAPTRPPAPQPR